MWKRIKDTLIGKAKDPRDQKIFHQMTLIAFFAWIGLGADGLSSSCYGPEEAFLAFGTHKYLSIFVALLSALTIFLISASYTQIIQLFPSGGGGYLVASRLLNPTVGMVSGCALLIDYVLTIAISVACGVDALFSFLPPDLLYYKLFVEFLGIGLLLVMNMRGVKESVVVLTPIFLVFILTHLFAIVYAIAVHVNSVPQLVESSVNEVGILKGEIGIWGVMFLILKAFSLGAGTFTGIEAVSNGLPILREPKAVTGKKTMQYMAWSLSFAVVGLMVGYLLMEVHKTPGKTLNASFLELLVVDWKAPWGSIFVWVTLLSEAMLLFVAAQTGFLGGPRVLASMALDRWVPSRFANFSDRLVSQNGVLVMGAASLIILAATQGSVAALVILYAINVFITFCLSQAGMVVHWWEVRRENKAWIKKICINGSGLLLTSFILVTMVVLKFHDGGWVTLAMTGALAYGAWCIRRHYLGTMDKLKRLDTLVAVAEKDMPTGAGNVDRPSMESKTAIILVNGFNGLGLHTLFTILRLFDKDYKNFVFIQVGVIDAGNFKDSEEFARLKEKVEGDLRRYETLMRAHGYYSKGYYALGTDVTLEIEQLTVRLSNMYNRCIVFGGQLVFEHESLLNRVLHNYTIFAVHKRLYAQGIPMMVLPVRV